MASSIGKCVKCNRGRVKTGSTLCTACTRKNGLIQAQRSDYCDVVVLVSEPLMYAHYHRYCASRDSIVKVMVAFYTSDTLSGATCMLWSHFEDSNLLEPMHTRLTSCNRSDRDAMSDAILRGIGSLIENGIKVQCVARDWLILKSHPEGVNELSLAEKLADLEGKLKVLVDTLGGTKSDAATNGQKISASETDSKLHGQLIQQVLAKTNNHNAKYPSLAEVVAGGSSTRPLQKTETSLYAEFINRTRSVKSVNTSHEKE